MRTSGTFKDVFEAVREHESENNKHLPHNPVVRREGSIWVLDSGLTPTEDCDLEISYEAFLGYWSEGLNDASYTPSEADIESYLSYAKE